MEEGKARRPDPAARQPQDGERVKERAGGAAQEISAGHRWNLVYPTSPRARRAERGDSVGGTAAGTTGSEGGEKTGGGKEEDEEDEEEGKPRRTETANAEMPTIERGKAREEGLPKEVSKRWRGMVAHRVRLQPNTLQLRSRGFLRYLQERACCFAFRLENPSPEVPLEALPPVSPATKEKWSERGRQAASVAVIMCSHIGVPKEALREKTA